MKKISIAITLLVIAFGLSLGQKTTAPAKRKTVSAATISRLPAGKTYELDLTRKGTIYDFNGEATDFSRVTVRTAAGLKTMAELLKTSESHGKGQLTVGSPADMRGPKLSPSRIGGGTTNFTCSGLFCGCTGDVDCNNMFSGGACGSIAWCYNDRCYCVARERVKLMKFALVVPRKVYAYTRASYSERRESDINSADESTADVTFAADARSGGGGYPE